MPVLAFVVAVACVSLFADGGTGTRWAILSITVPMVLTMTRPRAWTIGDCLGLLFLCWASCSLLWTPGLGQGLFTLWSLVLFFTIGWLPTCAMSDIYKGLGLGLSLNGLIVALQVAGYHPVTEAIPPAGLFYNKNAGAEMTALALIGVLTLNWKWRIACSPMLITLLAFPGNTLSRTPLVALAVAGACWTWTRSKLYGCMVVLAAVLLLLAFVLTTSRAPSANLRMELWGDMIRHLRWWGHGVGSTDWTYPFMEFAHNDFLQIAFELGAVGAVLWVGFLVCCLAGPLRTESYILIAFCVTGCFAFPLFMPGTVFVAGLAAGHLLRHRRALRDSMVLRELDDLRRDDYPGDGGREDGWVRSRGFGFPH